jgi:hypothetical protein
MSKKIPPDAFEQYMALGPSRSYRAVATRYKVSKRAVTNLALREKWQEKVQDLESKAKEAAVQKSQETLEAINARHLKALRVIQGKALEALRQMPLESAMDAVRAIDIAVRQERVIVGEPSERSAVSVEEVIKREYERWLVPGTNGEEETHERN